MNIQAEINATVEVFLADLAELVRRVAIESVRHALAAESGHGHGQGSGRALKPAAPRKRAQKPAAVRRGGSAHAEAAGLRAKAGVTPPAPKWQAALQEQERSPFPRRMVPGPPPKVPVTKAQPAKPQPAKPQPPAPPPRITVIPPVRARGKRGNKAAPAPKPPPVEVAAAPSEALPARRWVVVRRPARDRQDAGSADAGTGTPGPNRLP